MTAHIKFISRSLCIVSLLFAINYSIAQSPLTVLENRLCKTWKLDRSSESGKSSLADQALSDFVMILNADHTAKQGMAPDGLIGGKWSLNEKTMTLTIKDDVTAQEYNMKITSLTTDELILQDPVSKPAAFIHYRAK